MRNPFSDLRKARSAALAAHVDRVRQPTYIDIGDGLTDRTPPYAVTTDPDAPKGYRLDPIADLETLWRAERDRAASVMGDGFEWSDFDSGTRPDSRPDSRAGREGR